MVNLKIQKALNFAAIKHKDQLRKKSDIPYIVHPAECMQILTQLNCNENIIIAGILHDIIEDTDTGLQEIKDLFGDKIAELVNNVTEQNKDLPWQTRKDNYFEHIEKCDIDSHYVCFADKLANLRSIYADYLEMGDLIWEKFNSRKDCQDWFYKKVYTMLKETEIAKTELYKEYGELLKLLFS